MEKICPRCRRVCFSALEFANHPCFDYQERIERELEQFSVRLIRFTDRDADSSSDITLGSAIEELELITPMIRGEIIGKLAAGEVIVVGPYSYKFKQE